MMAGGTIATLIQKDLKLIFRNKLFGVMTLVFFACLVVIYFLLPRSIDEGIDMAVFGDRFPASVEQLLEEDGLSLEYVDSDEALRKGILEGDFQTGIRVPGNLSERLARGEKPGIRVYVPSEMPDDLKDAYTSVVKNLILLIGGVSLNIEDEEEVLGPDMTGRQIPTRKRLLPIFAFFIIFVEIMTLANLIIEEIQRGTLKALLVSAVRVESLLTAKAITGLCLAFLQIVLIMAVSGALLHRPILVLLTILLGGFMVVGLGFLIAAVSKEMLSVVAWSILVLVVSFLSAANVIFPGAVSNWIRIIPSYYLVDVLHRVINFQSGWTDVYGDLLLLLVFDAVFLLAGTLALRRKLL